MKTANEPGVSRTRLWFGLLGGVIAWTVHLLGAYGISEFGCRSRASAMGLLQLSVVTWLLLALTAATLTTAIAATFVAFGSNLQLSRNKSNAENPHDYMARAGCILSGLSALIIAIESIPILYYLRGC